MKEFDQKPDLSKAFPPMPEEFPDAMYRSVREVYYGYYNNEKRTPKKRSYAPFAAAFSFLAVALIIVGVFYINNTLNNINGAERAVNEQSMAGAETQIPEKGLNQPAPAAQIPDENRGADRGEVFVENNTLPPIDSSSRRGVIPDDDGMQGLNEPEFDAELFEQQAADIIKKVQQIYASTDFSETLPDYGALIAESSNAEKRLTNDSFDSDFKDMSIQQINVGNYFVNSNIVESEIAVEFFSAETDTTSEKVYLAEFTITDQGFALSRLDPM